MACGFNLQTRQPTAVIQVPPHMQQPAAAPQPAMAATPAVATPQPAAAPTGFRANSPVEEAAQANLAIKVMAVLMILWAAMPVYNLSGLTFPNIGMFKADNTWAKIFAVYPILMGICLFMFLGNAFAKIHPSLSNQRPGRSYVLMGVNLLLLIALLSGKASMGDMMSGMMIIPGVGNTVSEVNSFFTLFQLGWVGLIMGGIIRFYRPESMVGFVIAAIGAVCALLCWLIPVADTVPLAAIFKIWKIPSQAVSFIYKLLAFLILLAFCGLQIAAAVFTFMALPAHPQQRQSASGLKAFQLESGSIIVLLAGLIIVMLYILLKNFSVKALFGMITSLVYGVSMILAMVYAIPFVAADLFIGLRDKPSASAMPVAQPMVPQQPGYPPQPGAPPAMPPPAG